MAPDSSECREREVYLLDTLAQRRAEPKPRAWRRLADRLRFRSSPA